MTKQDTNYIAAVEKAVAQKYGKTAVQDFRSQWSEEKEKDYLKSLKKANQKKDKCRLPEKNKDLLDERTCPVCKTYSFSSKDDLYMLRYKCCFQCYIEHVLGRESQWKSGNRPTSEVIKILVGRRK